MSTKRQCLGQIWDVYSHGVQHRWNINNTSMLVLHKAFSHHNIKSRTDFKIVPLTYRFLRGQTPTYEESLIAPYHPNRALRSLSAGVLVVLRNSLKAD